MKSDLIKLPLDPYQPNEGAGDVVAMAKRLSKCGQAAWICSAARNAELRYLLQQVARSVVVPAKQVRRLSWRERISGRASL